MHFGFSLDLSDIDLLNVDLLDHLDLFVFKTSWRRLQSNNFSSSKTSSIRFARCLQDVFKTSSRHLWRRRIVTLNTCWRRLQVMSWRRLQDVMKTNKCLLGLVFNNANVSSSKSKKHFRYFIRFKINFWRAPQNNS